jgi:hypothetical protein
MARKTRRAKTPPSDLSRRWRAILGDGRPTESQLIALTVAILANRPISELTKDWDQSREDAWPCERHASALTRPPARVEH